jgi:Tol biopolymer transport system component
VDHARGGGEAREALSVGKGEGLVPAADWSPDATEIAYIRPEPASARGALEILTLKNGHTRVLLSDKPLALIAYNVVKWLADGRILFGVFKGNNTQSDLWAVNSASTGRQDKLVRLTNTTGSMIGGLSASVDGKQLAVMFVRYPALIFVANQSKTGHKLEHSMKLTNDSWNSWPESWTNDSQELFYTSARRNLGYYKHHITSGKDELFLSGNEDYMRSAVSPDGRWIIIEAKQASGQRRLVRIPVSGGTSETLLTLAGPGNVKCTRSGSGICVLYELNARQAVFSAIDPVKGRLEELVRIESKSSPEWDLSPDGSKVALVEGLSDGVRILHLDTHQVQEIHPNPVQSTLQGVAWSSDGNQLFLSAEPDGNGTLLEMEITGQTRFLLENRQGWIVAPTPSPDGRYLAYSTNLHAGNVTLIENF